MTNGLANSVAQRLFIGGSKQPSTPPSSAAGPLITIIPGPRMEGISSCYADGRGRECDPWGHDREDCDGDRGEFVGSYGVDPACHHPPDASISPLVIEGPKAT